MKKIELEFYLVIMKEFKKLNKNLENIIEVKENEEVNIELYLKSDYIIKKLQSFNEELKLNKEHHINVDDLMKMIKKILIK